MRDHEDRRGRVHAAAGPRRRSAWAIAAFVVLSVLPSLGVAIGRAPPLRVLFVGNSYLYVNDLPAQVRRMAAAEGVVLETVLVAQPDFALSDHLRNPGFLAQLDRRWDWIVLQQGPSSLPESRDELIAGTRTIAARLRGRPVRIALLSGWPAKQYLASSIQGEASYRLAATGIGACVMPVATAWRLARENGKSPSLHAQDGLHATRTGTRLAAMVVLRGLLGGAAASARASPVDSGSKPKRGVPLEQIVMRAFEQEPAGCRRA